MFGSERKHISPACPPSPRAIWGPRHSVPPAAHWHGLPGTPPFIPAAGLANRHLQTLFASAIPGRIRFADTVQRTLRLSDGDYVVLHDDQPDGWKWGDPTALLLHGISGCHRSGYLMRIAAKLNARGIRSFRMDHRGCGAGHGLAEKPYHAGRIADLHGAIGLVESLCPSSDISVAGFSLSGNLLLRYLGDQTYIPSPSLFRAVAVCPPVDLQHCVRQLSATRTGQRYDWYFTRRLINQIACGPQWREDLPLAQTNHMPCRLYDFDELYTAPASGYQSADDYYFHASAKNVLRSIRVPTTILAAKDDPLVDYRPLLDVKLPLDITLCLTMHGGHLGFVGRRHVDPDRRWMDWRVIDWLLE